MTRLRELGIELGSLPTGRWNAITDVAGVRVGHATLISGEGRLRIGEGPVRTGVTAIFPHEGMPTDEPVFAGTHRLNGNGEITGLEWLRESGKLTSPIALTNTWSVGAVRDALVEYEWEVRGTRRPYWSIPVVGETSDLALNDMQGMHVGKEHVFEALAGATSGPVTEGSVGGGTGMTAHGFKGGIGTSSRVVPAEVGGWTVGVLVQANHGRRERLMVDGVPVGARIPASEIPTPELPDLGGGSIIVVVATDAPLLPLQCDRLAQRAALGIGRVGGVGEHYSGDLMLAFSTGNRGMPSGDYFGEEPPITYPVQILSDHYVTPLYDAVTEATEEAILNALLGAETMIGRDGVTAYALTPERLLSAMDRDGGSR
jgi:D-aminopeptidase